MSGKTVEVTCKCCPDKFIARVSDRNRGWALIPAANDPDVFDVPTRGRHNKWCYEGLGEYV